jgi:predicted O-linked N-acetylglucosamine transferase (SPINDLY family)
MPSANVSLPIADAFERAIALQRTGHFAEAMRICEAIVAARPDHFDALHLRGLVAAQARRYEDAEHWLGRALALVPRSPEASVNRASVRNALRRFDAALEDADRVLDTDPRHVPALYQRGLALQNLGRLDDALASYVRALEIVPDFVQALVNRGAAEQDLGRPDAALASLDRALAIEPRNADAHYNRGLALQRLARHQEALASYARALAARPDFAEAHNNRGLNLHRLRRYAEAEACYDEALALRPRFGEALFNRGAARSSQGHHPEAVRDVERALELAPGLPFAPGMLLHSRMHACDWRSHDEDVARLVAGVREGRRCIEPLPFVGVSDSARDQRRCARIWIDDRLQRMAPPPPGRDRRHDRIRVAYLSADFRDHATARLAAGVFERHDRRRFETIAVTFGPEVADAMTGRLARAFDRWVDVRPIGDGEAARLLADMAIDIAVDLKGFTDDARPQILAYRPAPVQVSWLGYPGTMGADHIDYIVADRTVIPPGEEAFYAEKIVRLPDSYQSNDRERPIAARIPTRAEAGLPGAGFVFCSFNNNWKITPRMFGVWMQLLRRVDGSVLWLLEGHPAVPGNLRREAAQRGVDPRRLVFAPRLRLDTHLARHSLADLFLDTLPCNAHTTASDALWAGLPVLTQLGTTFAGRVAASVLDAVGLPELIVQGDAAYFDTAVALATDAARLADIRARLARNRLCAPLFDADRFRHHLEAAYVEMWARHERGDPPASFAVAPV